jgi:hypothetical protein
MGQGAPSMNAIIKVAAIVGLCAAAMGLMLEVIYPPLAFVASLIFISCLLSVILTEMKD